MLEIETKTLRIQMGSDAKSYLGKGLQIYEEMSNFLPIYEDADSNIWLCTQSLLISLYMRKILFYFFNSVSVVI
jgi:hypothetical protein